MKVTPSTADLNTRLNGIDQMMEAKHSPLAGLIKTAFGSAGQSPRRSIMFTSAEPRAGVSWMASTVAVELAAAGRKVLLADAEVIASVATAESAVSLCHRIGSGRIWVLGREQVAHAVYHAQYGRAQPRATLSELSQEFPQIVLDAPALSVSGVAVRFASVVAGSVLVVREGRTETLELMKARDLLSSLGGIILGCVYNVH